MLTVDVKALDKEHVLSQTLRNLMEDCNLLGEEKRRGKFTGLRNLKTGTEESIGIGHSSKETRSSQDYILMPLWKDGSLFDSSSKNASNDEPQPSSDAGKKDDEGVSQEITTAPLEATHADFFGDETELDMSNITTTYLVPTTPNTRIHKDHSLDHVIGDVQTRRMTKTSNEQGFISAVYEGKTHEDLHTCLFACFLSQVEPKKVIQALTDPRPLEQNGIYDDKKDKRRYCDSEKQTRWLQGLHQEVGIDYSMSFCFSCWIEAIRLFLAYASFKDFVVYQMDVKSAFLYGKIEEEVYVCQPPGFENIIMLMHEADPRLQVTQKDDGIFISQDKYVDEILKKFGFSTVKTASTPKETSKPLLKDAEAKDVDVHLYRSMIGSLMYLTASRPDIMFVVCACARFQVTPKVSHLHAVKRIFRYLKGQPKLGLWYPKDSPFDFEAYTDSDFAGASLDRKSTTRGCQFLGSRLISWQCKKQTIVANSTTEAEYVAAASCCGQIFIDNESTICIVKNPVFHSKTKHIEIRHHFIRDSNEKKLIQMIKIHTDQNVADLLTKAFDVGRFQYLIAIDDAIQVSTIGLTYYCTLDNREIEITATIDRKVKTVSEASIRRHLKLEDFDGISNLPTTEIFEQLALMGSKKTAWEQFSSNIAIAIICLATNRKFNFSKMIFDGMGPVVQGEGSAHPINVADKAPSTGVDVRLGGATTTVTGLEVRQGSGNIDKTYIMPHDSPLPRVHTLGSDEDRMQHNELMNLVTRLSYGDGRKIAEIHEDPDISLVQHDEEVQGRHKHDMEPDFEVEVDEEFAQRLQSEERETYFEAKKARLLAKLINERKRYFAAQRAKERRKKPLTQAQYRTYMSQYIKNIERHTLKQLKSYSFDEIKNLLKITMRRVHTLILIESESERVIPELAAGSSKRDAEEELVQESSKKQKTGESSEPVEEPKNKEEEELSQERIQQMMIIVPKQGMNVEALQTKYLIIDWKIYTERARKYWKIIRVVKDKFTSTEPTKDKEREIWVELKRLFKPDTYVELWKLQKHMHDNLTWNLYDSCGVHHVSIEDGIDIYMLVEKSIHCQEELSH
ncbi:putative ribonuclease H-like domain-containing protein [Tanacetum coccineum]